jgi:hypothetical protein
MQIERLECVIKIGSNLGRRRYGTFELEVEWVNPIMSFPNKKKRQIMERVAFVSRSPNLIHKNVSISSRFCAKIITRVTLYQNIECADIECLGKNSS